MEVLIAIIVMLFGGLVYTNQKRKSAEALNENLETKEQILEKEKLVNRFRAEAGMEEVKREHLKDWMEKETGRELGMDELEGFFNKLTDNE